MNKECDVVVIGGGGSGLTAAVRCAQKSGKRVIVLEKAGSTGGGMRMASTMRTFRSKWQKERNIKDVTDAYLRKVMQDSYWRIDKDLAREAILATGEFFDWFLEIAGSEHGDKFHVGRYVFDDENGQEGPQMGGPGGVTGGGRLFMDELTRLCGDYGVEVLTRHKATQISKEADGIKVAAEGKNGEVIIDCQSIIIASGSWINNEAVVKRICPDLHEAMKHMGTSPHTNPNYTGDAFELTKELDLMHDEANYTIRMMGPMVFSKAETLPAMADSPFSVMVNKEAGRFACEPTQPNMGVFNSGLVMMEQPEGLAYIIFDTANLEAAIADDKANPRQSFCRAIPVMPFPESAQAAREQIEAAAKKEKGIYIADTVEELANAMGLSAKSLKNTIDAYNSYCEDGFDRECFKDKKYLVPMTKAPFYGVYGMLGTDGAFGGISVNSHMQALKEDGSVMENVYVTGDFASGRFINKGGEKVQILNDMSWALASGFIAGSNA